MLTPVFIFRLFVKGKIPHLCVNYVFILLVTIENAKLIAICIFLCVYGIKSYINNNITLYYSTLFTHLTLAYIVLL